MRRGGYLRTSGKPRRPWYWIGESSGGGGGGGAPGGAAAADRRVARASKSYPASPPRRSALPLLFWLTVQPGTLTVACKRDGLFRKPTGLTRVAEAALCGQPTRPQQAPSEAEKGNFYIFTSFNFVFMQTCLAWLKLRKNCRNFEAPHTQLQKFLELGSFAKSLYFYSQFQIKYKIF